MKPEVAALGDDARAQLARVDAHRVVGAVADVGVGLARSPSRRCRCRRSRAGRRGIARIARTSSWPVTRAGVEPERARAPASRARCVFAPRGQTPPPVEIFVWVVVRPARAAAARRGACARAHATSGSGSGSRNTWRWSNAASSRARRASSSAVAEDVARHVADAGGGVGVALGVDAELGEVVLRALPRAARGDRELLVVVALGAARRERVAEPEVALERDRVRGVGEVRGALVGRDDQVRVVAVAAVHAGRRHDARPRRRGRRSGRGGPAMKTRYCASAAARASRAREPAALQHEAALRADRHDQPVLQHLRPHQAEHLGAEVVEAVAPADARRARPGRRAGGCRRPRRRARRSRGRAAAAAAPAGGAGRA